MEAQAFAGKTQVDILKGIHVPLSVTLTVAQAGDKWIEHCQEANLEHTTIEQYKQHLRLHIKPFIGQLKLPQVTVPAVTEFQSMLRKQKRSDALVRGVTGSLRAIFATAQESGHINQNPVSALSHRRHTGTERRKKKLRIGVDIPTPDEVRAIIGAARGALAAIPVDGDLHRSARIGAAWLAVERYRPQ